jgi:hypothetical protein
MFPIIAGIFSQEVLPNQEMNSKRASSWQISLVLGWKNAEKTVQAESQPDPTFQGKNDLWLTLKIL